MVILKHINKSP